MNTGHFEPLHAALDAGLVGAQHSGVVAGTVTLVVAAFAELPRPAVSVSHTRTVYVPAVGAVICAPPDVLTCIAVPHDPWQSCA